MRRSSPAQATWRGRTEPAGGGAGHGRAGGTRGDLGHRGPQPIAAEMREPAADQADDPPADRGQQAADLEIGRRPRGGHEAHRAVRRRCEHALGDQGVEVDVGVERRAAALDRGDRAAATDDPRARRRSMVSHKYLKF